MITTPQQLFSLSIRRLLQVVIFSMILSLPAALQAQETNNWYFGSAGGFPNTGIRIDFTSGSPVVSTYIPMLTEEGSSSISDANGNPLFYTNGVSIWDASTNVAFGTGMNGGQSSTQSAVIMPKPGTNNQWLVFTSGDNGNPGLSYYTVTGTGSPGVSPFTLSGVTNLVAGGVAGEGLSIIGSTKTNSAFWVVVRDNGGTGIVRTFEVTNTGVVNATPVTSTLSGPAGFTNTTYSSTIGSIKANTCQNRLAFTYLNSHVDMVDFNAATGEVVTNTARRINVASAGGNSGSYGIEFSSNDAYLYITNLSGGLLYRHDIVANTTAVFGTVVAGKEAGELQSAPDGKIYMAIKNASPTTPPSYLDAINNPGAVGATYTQNAVLLSGVTSTGGNTGFSFRGLPTFPKNLIVGTLVVNPGNGGYCVNTAIPLSFSFTGSINTATISWAATGGGQTFTPGGASSTSASPSVSFSSFGTKTVTLTFNDICGRTYTETMTFEIAALKTPSGTVTCSAPNLILDNPLVDPDEPNYIWYKNSVADANIIGTGTPVTYALGSDGSAPSSICVSVASSAPTVVSSLNKTIAGSNALGSAANVAPYTSPTFDVLADRLVLKSFRTAFRFAGTYSLTVTIRQGATVVYTNTASTGAVGGGVSFPVNVNTSLLKGTGYTITISTPGSDQLNYGVWNGALNPGEIAYNSGPSPNTVSIASLAYDAFTYTATGTCATPACYSVTCSLPVEWLSLDAKKLGHAVNVKWDLAKEENNSRFDVQRSLDGINFTTVGSVPSKGDYNGYRAYEFVDLYAVTAKTYYKVMQYDIDGKFSSSTIVVVYPENGIHLISIYPNPSSHDFSMEWYAETAAPYQVFDVRGTVVAAGTLDASKGVETIGANFVSGVYIVKVFMPNETVNLKLIKQ